MRLLLLAAIRFYQRCISPHKGFSCAYRHHTGRASCSTFGFRAVRRYGVFSGLGLIRERTQRCGAVHRHFHPRQRPPLSQRGDCDPGCDLSCDGDVVSSGLDLVGCCDCGGCDGPSRRRAKGGEKYVYIPPNARLRQRVADA